MNFIRRAGHSNTPESARRFSPSMFRLRPPLIEIGGLVVTRSPVTMPDFTKAAPEFAYSRYDATTRRS